MNAKPFTRYAFALLRVLLTAVLLLGLGPVAEPAAMTMRRSACRLKG